MIIDLPIIGGIMACGIFLIMISILGLIGAVKHHQVVLFFVSFLYRPKCVHNLNSFALKPVVASILLGVNCNIIRIVYSFISNMLIFKDFLNKFQYMVILFMLFLVQFSVACACLAVNKEQQRNLAKKV